MDEPDPAAATAVATKRPKEASSQSDIGLCVTGIGEPLRKQRRLRPQQPRGRPPATRDMCHEAWRLDSAARSHEAVLLSPTAVLFHPRWSNGHAGVMAQQQLQPHLSHYWEVTLGERVFGTAMQLGVCTRRARLHADDFVANLLGQDEHSWGLSHQGFAWHAGRSRRICEPFAENRSCVVGVLFEGPRRRLSFFKDSVPLGCAFDNVGTADDSEPLYPALSSTAAKTCMSVTRQLRSYADLQDRCCAVLARSAACREAVLRRDCPLPPAMRRAVLQRM